MAHTHHCPTQIFSVLYVSGHASSSLTVRVVHHAVHLMLSMDQPVFQVVVWRISLTVKINVKHVPKSAKLAISLVVFNAQTVQSTYLARIVCRVAPLYTRIISRWYVKVVEIHARVVLQIVLHVVAALTNTHWWSWKALAIKYVHQNTFPKTVTAKCVHKEIPPVTSVHLKRLLSAVHHV